MKTVTDKPCDQNKKRCRRCGRVLTKSAGPYGPVCADKVAKEQEEIKKTDEEIREFIRNKEGEAAPQSSPEGGEDERD